MEHNPAVTAKAVESTPMVTPSPTFYSELATAMVAALDQFNASVPDFDALTVTKDFIKRKRRVPPELISNAISALLVHVELQNVKALNAEQALDDRQFIDALVPVARHLQSAFKALTFSIEARQARLAATSQQIYAVAKAFARDRDMATLGVHVQNMQRALKPATRRSKKAAGGTEAAAGKEETTTIGKTKSQQQ